MTPDREGWTKWDRTLAWAAGLSCAYLFVYLIAKMALQII